MNQKSLTIDTEVSIPIKFDSGKFVTFKNEDGSECEHFAICFSGYSDGSKSPLVRIHSECLTGDIFGSEKCDCGDQLNEALRLLAREGGVLIYLRQEGRGIGLNQKLKAYKLQNQGLDTFAANRALGFDNDLRSFDIAAAILKALGIQSVKLLTNNPEKEDSLIENNIQVDEVRRTGVFVKTHNLNYLTAKKREAGHRIQFENEREKINLFPRLFVGELTC